MGPVGVAGPIGLEGLWIKISVFISFLLLHDWVVLLQSLGARSFQLICTSVAKQTINHFQDYLKRPIVRCVITFIWLPTIYNRNTLEREAHWGTNYTFRNWYNNRIKIKAFYSKNNLKNCMNYFGKDRWRTQFLNSYRS